MSVHKSIVESSDISLQRVRVIQIRLTQWGGDHYADFPWRSTANPFHSLIAEIMLQRTKAAQVVPVYNEFTRRYPTFFTAREENPERLIELIAKLGLRWRAERIIKLLDELSARNGTIPEIKEELVKLPNVGDYIANAYLSLHRGVKQPITDSNAVRLWSRLLGFIREEGIHKKKWFYNLCQHLTPDENFREFNYALLDFSREICKTRPLCNDCPLNDLCEYHSDTA